MLPSALTVQDISLRAFFHVQTLATGSKLRIQIGKLRLGQLDAITLDVGNQGGMHEQIEHETSHKTNQRYANSTNDKEKPGCQTKHKGNDTQSAFVRIYELVYDLHPLAQIIFQICI